MKCLRCGMAGAYYRIKTDDTYCRSCGKATKNKRVKQEEPILAEVTTNEQTQV
jgi:hypothetical protein